MGIARRRRGTVATGAIVPAARLVAQARGDFIDAAKAVHPSERGARPMIKAVKFVSVPVRDQDQSLAFYTETLGFRVVTDQPMGEQRWIELRVPGAETGFVLFTPPGHEDRIGGLMNMAF